MWRSIWIVAEYVLPDKCYARAFPSNLCPIWTFHACINPFPPPIWWLGVRWHSVAKQFSLKFIISLISSPRALLPNRVRWRTDVWSKFLAVIYEKLSRYHVHFLNLQDFNKVVSNTLDQCRSKCKYLISSIHMKFVRYLADRLDFAIISWRN